MRNLFLRLGAAALAAAPILAIVVLTAPSAHAHSSLIASSPAAGSTLTQQPGAVELTFSEAVQTEFAQVAVLDDAETEFQAGEPQVVGSVVTQAVGTLPDGNYTISYRIVSADGHPVTGTVDFTVAAGTSETGSPVLTQSAEPIPAAESDTDDDLSPGLIAAIAGGAAIIVGIIAFVAAGGRFSKPRGDTGP